MVFLYIIGSLTFLGVLVILGLLITTMPHTPLVTVIKEQVDSVVGDHQAQFIEPSLAKEQLEQATSLKDLI